ncbi:MAG TPA: AmiS/UreI family transporter [Segeticoccus sp.]|nr:AmiS/UreI family transporter [Segeticoccus sp.]
MSAVALIYVGAVLFINGILLLGRVTPREAAPMNLFVGALQVLTPTVLIIMGATDDRAVFAASGLYLFGFTYLWVGINGAAGWGNRGLGWFSLFVAACAVVYSLDSFLTDGDPAFGVIWLVWSVLWFLFFLVLGLGLDHLAARTGAFTVVVAFVTAAIPAFLLLLGHWTGSWAVAVTIAVVSVAALVGAPIGDRLAAPEEDETKEVAA